MSDNIFNFEKLEVYKKSLGFVDEVYEIINKFPRDERFSLADQFRRAATSIVLNVAEGYGLSKLQFKRYLNIAKASTRECVAIITISSRRKYINQNQENELRNHCCEISKMISGLIKSLG